MRLHCLYLASEEGGDLRARPTPVVLEFTPEPLHKMPASPESLHTTAASPESLHKMADMPEHPAIMATTSEPPAVMDVIPQPSAITDATPVFPVIENVAFEDVQAFQRHLGLITSLVDTPLISARAAGISRASALVVTEPVPFHESALEATPVWEPSESTPEHAPSKSPQSPLQSLLQPGSPQSPLMNPL